MLSIHLCYITHSNHHLFTGFYCSYDASEAPTELTSGKQGAIHSPVFNTQGTKVAWLELDEDGYEADR